VTDSAETKLARLEERHEAMVERVDKLESAVGDIEKCVARLATSVSLITWKVGVVIGALLFIGQIALKKLGLM
jgi:wobble nucleotide-excising tRNase